MFRNYITIALRSIAKNKLYSAINIVGLAVALSVYLLAQVIADYETHHDTFFDQYQRIYAIWGNFRPGSDVGVDKTSAVPLIVGPLARQIVSEAQSVARMNTSEVLARSGDKKFYQDLRFVDPEFLDIFSFDFVSGSKETALSDPSGVILTEAAADKYFGEDDPLGKVITFGPGHDLRVTAVIRNLPLNSHFVFQMLGSDRMEMIAHMEAIEPITGEDPAGQWGNISFGDSTYVMLREGASVAAANAHLAELYEEHAPESNKELLESLYLSPLTEMNTYIWEATGLPMIAGIRVLGALVLLVACLNYVNLATAQAVRRTREVGIRKSMGASKKQLFVQFLVESTVVAGIALLFAAAVIDIVVPFINSAANKSIEPDLFSDPGVTLHLVLLVLGVGLLSGGYPAYLIARANSVSMLSGNFNRGRRGTWMRSGMLVLQFTISVFMIGMVAVIYFQNQLVAESSDIFQKDRIAVITRLGEEGVREQRDVLRTELARLDGVESIAMGSQAPYELSQSSRSIARNAGDEAGAITTRVLGIDDGFLATYEIPLLAGRNLDRNITNDTYELDEEDNPLRPVLNVMINELLIEQFGLGSPQEALGQSLYRLSQDGPSTEYRVVGVIPDVNFLGFQNKLKPYIYYMSPSVTYTAAIKIRRGQIQDTVAAIEGVWDRIFPNRPIQMHFLEEDFETAYQIFRGINVAVAIFAAVAVLLAGVGLFGLSAFMAERRTKEIGIRKVMGADVPAIVRLLIWQFSRPVVIAVVLGGILSALGSLAYLQFFSERIGLNPLLFIGVGLGCLLFAAFTVAGHALRVARANPVHALRYE